MSCWNNKSYFWQQNVRHNDTLPQIIKTLFSLTILIRNIKISLTGLLISIFLQSDFADLSYFKL